MKPLLFMFVMGASMTRPVSSFADAVPSGAPEGVAPITASAPQDLIPSNSKPEVAAFPLMSFSSDTGLGLGLRGVIERPSEHVPPYDWSVEAQGFATTGGTQFHFVSFDVPRLAGSSIRVDALAGYYRNSAAPYYGIGDHPIPSDAAPAGYYAYLEQIPVARCRVRAAIVGDLSVAFGYRFLAQTVVAAQGSLLAHDAPLGINGGPYGEASIGLAFDTRDDEMSPTRGVLLEVTGRSTGPPFGSRYVATGAFVAAAVYQEIVSRVVAAARVAADATWGQVPFDRLQDFGSIVTPFVLMSGVGGGLTVRGLRQSEYIAPTKAIANAELRWRFLELRAWQHDVRLTSVTFADAGGVWQGGATLAELARGLHGTVGEGLRVAWGKLVVLRADAGYGEGDVRFYADFRNVF